MVIRQHGHNAVPGGAANVALNAAAWDIPVAIIGLVGQDHAADELKAALSLHPNITPHLIPDPSRVTTRKTRVLAGAGHQVLRIDNEDTHLAEGQTEDALIQAIAIQSANADALIFSDYRKGALTPKVVQSSKARLTAANAKPETLAHYEGIDLVTLNRSEAKGYAGEDPKTLEGAEKMARQIGQELKIGCVVITMGDQGLAAHWQKGSCQVKAPRVEVADVAGAGDTVIATAAIAASQQGFTQEVFWLAVQASARVVTHSGVVSITAQDLKEIAARRA
jgi:D-beta-D-heptose 7-phosphate kinase/D-beta-D-heptose 1-phosphate adenosyltransferase